MNPKAVDRNITTVAVVDRHVSFNPAAALSYSGSAVSNGDRQLIRCGSGGPRFLSSSSTTIFPSVDHLLSPTSITPNLTQLDCYGYFVSQAPIFIKSPRYDAA